MHHPHHPVLTSIAPPPTLYDSIVSTLNRHMMESYFYPTSRRTMCSTEQRSNLHLLSDQVIAFDIPGAFVELGCYEGQTAMVIASVMQYHGSERELHLYDDFDCDFSGQGNVKQRLLHSFDQRDLPAPIVHEGRFERTLPRDLPERIAFAHIDCGVGDLPEHHRQLMFHCLEAVYPRMSPGAIGVLMDYHDTERTVRGLDCNPGVKLACDRFFKHKPECIHILYGNRFSHAFFRKVW